MGPVSLESDEDLMSRLGGGGRIGMTTQKSRRATAGWVGILLSGSGLLKEKVFLELSIPVTHEPQRWPLTTNDPQRLPLASLLCQHRASDGVLSTRSGKKILLMI